jgi:hypothetical protein
VNTVLTGEAKFQFLHEKSAEEIQDALSVPRKHIDTSLNLISGRLGLDHDQVFFGRYRRAGDGALPGPAQRKLGR